MLSTIRTRSTLIQSLRGVLCDLLDESVSCRGQTGAEVPENNAEPRPVEQAGLGLLTAMPSSRATPPWTFPRQNRPHGPIKRRERTKPHPSRTDQGNRQPQLISQFIKWLTGLSSVRTI